MRKTVLSVITAATVALTLSACSDSDSDGKVDNDPPAGSNAAGSKDDADEEDETVIAEEVEETEETEEPATNPAFGQAYTWDNGLTVTVSAPEQFQPSEYAFVEGEGTPLKFTITVVNNTGDNYEPVGDYITLQSGNAEAASIYDMETLSDTPSTVLLDGREIVYSIGFMAADPADLVMEFQPSDYALDSVIFVS
ncbi:MAG: hypothetical protein PIR53_02730 [Nocardioides alkalitolerans]